MAPASTTLAPPAHAVDGLRLEQGELAWAGIRIGMTRAQIESLIGASLMPLEANDICANFVGTRSFGGLRVSFEFGSQRPDAPLEHMFIPLEGELPQKEQIVRLKDHLPGSTYVPSRYAPELAESNNPKPLYRVATHAPRVVMLSSDEGLWLGDPRCYD